MMNYNLGIGFGIDNFSKLKETAFYVDKTLFIKDFIYDYSEVVLITRPRRFGKSLNLSMIENFLDITKDSTHLFKDTLIYNYPEIISEHMNKYPVIHINFKNYATSSFKDFIVEFTSQNRKLFLKYKFIRESKVVESEKKEDFNNIINRTTNLAEQKSSLALLTEILYTYYNVKPIILIDEYDIPFDESYENGYYKELKDFMSSYLSKALKDNIYLGKSLIVGCKKVAQASLFSKFNNVKVYGIDGEKYNQYFGFTEDEVKKTLKAANLNTFDEVKYWYDGYNIGNITEGNFVTIYNPWSFLSYLDEKKFQPYWVNTGSEYLLKSLLTQIPNSYYQISILIQGGSVTAKYKNEITYESNLNNLIIAKDHAINLLYVSGYLKITEHLEDNFKEFKLVNNEVKSAITSMIESILSDDLNDISYLNRFVKAFLSLDFKQAEIELNEIMPAYKTFYNEHFFYGLMYYMFYITKDTIFDAEIVTSNGRSYFLIKSRDYSDAFIVEGKLSKSESVAYLTKVAFEQIEERKYDEVVRNFKYIHKVVVVIREGNAYLRLLDNKEYKYTEKNKDISKYLYKFKNK